MMQTGFLHIAKRVIHLLIAYNPIQVFLNKKILLPYSNEYNEISDPVKQETVKQLNGADHPLVFMSLLKYIYDVINEFIMEALMNQLTLRKIPLRVERQLRVHSKQKRMSLNKSAVALLSKALGVEDSPAPRRKRDLSRFLGSMNSDDAKMFDDNTRGFRAIDPELWNK
jgi:hypothetical protein